MRLILLGPPGSGKGTQAGFICERLAVPHVSTGDLFRGLAARDDSLGREAAAYMNRGELVPDTVVVGLVADRLSQSDCQGGFLLDGFPRTVNQAEALAAMLEKEQRTIDAVIDLEVHEDEVVRRLSGRRVCLNCGEIFHLETRPPKTERRCDRCGTELTHRADDYPETIRSRMVAYRRQTEPLVGYYDQRGVLVKIPGELSTEEVFAAILFALSQGHSVPAGAGEAVHG
jgi:adenylate kinase